MVRESMESVSLVRITVHSNTARKDYRIGTLRYSWPMSVHASQAFNTTVPIQKISPLDTHCTVLTDQQYETSSRITVH